MSIHALTMVQVRFESKPSAWKAEAVLIAAEEAARKSVLEKRRELQLVQESDKARAFASVQPKAPLADISSVLNCSCLWSTI